MHATYYCLTDIDDFAGANDLLNSIDHAIGGYAADWCDDNNGWTIEGAVLADDRQLVLSPKPRFEAVAGIWHKAWTAACKAVAWDMLVWYSHSAEQRAWWTDQLSGPSLTADAVRGQIRASLPLMLKSHYAMLISKSTAAVDRLTSCRRAHLSRQFELFSAAEHETCAPVLMRARHAL